MLSQSLGLPPSSAYDKVSAGVMIEFHPLTKTLYAKWFLQIPVAFYHANPLFCSFSENYKKVGTISFSNM